MGGTSPAPGKDRFAHLHVHTEYSMLDGASRLDDVIAAAVRDGQPGLGITDHGNMYGVLDFYRKCVNAGIRPVIGTEAYMAYESRLERPARRSKVDDSGGDAEGGKKLYYHLTLLAENNAGYKNLIQVASRSFLEGYYYKPRCDWEMLSDHSEGLIVTTGCLGGQVPQALLKGDEAGALERAGRLREIFGPGNFFVELQDHDIPDQHRANPGLLRIARKLGAPLLATNDSHYTHRSDAEAHDVLLCVQTNSLLADADRFKFHGDQHYLKSAAEMRRLFSEPEVVSACDNTLAVVERAGVEIEFGEPQLPDFPVPEGFGSDRDYLRHLALEGAKQRWGDPPPERATERIVYELDVINNMGFASYFLITWDLIRHARECGIRVGPGRGSAAGCAVAYALRITDLDPIRHDLLFERFLNPDRVSMPDIDMDFDSRYRDEMIRYVAERYGRDRVAQIVTFSQIKARAAVRDAARVLGYEYSVGDRIAKAMPPLIMGRDTPLAQCLEEDPEYAEGYKAAADLRAMVETDHDAARVVEAAKGLEGLRRQDGIHAAAVVITKEPLTDYMPVQRKPESGKPIEEAPIVTQYEMHGVEDLGLLKMDFLGLRNLDVITDCVDMIRRTRGVEIDIDNPDIEDAATYELLQRGDTVGVFQLESGPMRALIRALAPTCLDDVCALVALYRPGPMAHNMHNDYADRKNGRQEVKHIHPDSEEILGGTYGLMIYQEDVMRMAQRFAGYTMAEADSLRKAMGKKIRAAMEEEKEKFVSGAESLGYGKKLGKDIFSIIERFADYAFNKSHSYGYGYIAYQTAYLKANYPVEYMASLLTSVKSKQETTAVYLNECRHLGITVNVPDINESMSAFTPVYGASGGQGKVLFGLSAIRHVGDGLAAKVLAERSQGGPFGSFADFVDRADQETVNKRAVESLIKAGAFDSLGHTRLGLLRTQSLFLERSARRRRDAGMGAVSLFADTGGDDSDPAPDIPGEEMGRREKMAAEKEILGMHISDHPLRGVDESVMERVDSTAAGLGETESGRTVTVCGVVSGMRRRSTRNGDPMAIFTVEDMSGPVEAVMFSRTIAGLEERSGRLPGDDDVVMATGRVEHSERGVKLLVSEAETVDTAETTAPPVVHHHGPGDRPLSPPDTTAGTGTAAMRLKIPAGCTTDAAVSAIRRCLTDHPGDDAVELEIAGRWLLKLPADLRVDRRTAGPQADRLLQAAAR